MSAFQEQSQQTAEAQQQEQQQQQTQSAFEQLVGEGKKFNSQEDLAKGKVESDRFIEQLQSELSGLREELDKRMTSEEVLAKIREETNSANQAQGEQTSPSLSEDKVAELVKNTLESTRTEEQRNTNLKAVDDKLVELYGDKANAELTKKANELGVGVDFLAGVAMQSPAAFFNTVGINTNQQTTPGVTQSTVNTEALAQTGGQAPQQGSKEYFDNLRKENPREYWNPKTQNLIMQARAAGTYNV